MDNSKRLRRSNSIIFVAFIAMLLSYVVFLSSLGDIFDGTICHNPFTNYLNSILSNLMDGQLVALLVALLLVTSALAFQKGVTASKYLKFIPLILVLFPTVMAGFYFGCRIFPKLIYQLDFGWGNLIFPPLLLIVPLFALIQFRTKISLGIGKVSWLVLAVLVLIMLVQMVETLVWGILAWSTSQPEVVRMAYGYDRTLMPGDYHIWLGLGLTMVVLFGGLAIVAWLDGLPAWRTRNESPEMQ